MTKEQEYYVKGMEDMLSAVEVAFDMTNSIDKEDLASLREMIDNYAKSHGELSADKLPDFLEKFMALPEEVRNPYLYLASLMHELKLPTYEMRDLAYVLSRLCEGWELKKAERGE